MYREKTCAEQVSNVARKRCNRHYAFEPVFVLGLTFTVAEESYTWQTPARRRRVLYLTTAWSPVNARRLAWWSVFHRSAAQRLHFQEWYVACSPFYRVSNHQSCCQGLYQNSDIKKVWFCKKIWLVCLKTNNHLKKEGEEILTLQMLEALYRETFGRALELEAEHDLPESVEGCSTSVSWRVWEVWTVWALLSLLMTSEKHCLESLEH